MRTPRLAFMIAIMILHSTVHHAQASPSAAKAGTGHGSSTARVERAERQGVP
jgi:hypothetical protein